MNDLSLGKEFAALGRSVDELLRERTELLIALKEAAEFIKSMDGGDPSNDTGWRSEEYMDAWLKCRAAIELATRGAH